MLDEPIRQLLKSQIGITDEDLNRLSLGIQKLLSRVPELLKWKIIAEVTDSKYCFAGCKVGDKLVFSGTNLIPEESTCSLCLGAISPMMERMHMMWDRIADGRDPNGLWTSTVECYDKGVEYGGLGKVVFKVYAEKTE